MPDLTPIEKKQRQLREMEVEYIKAKEHVNGVALIAARNLALSKIEALIDEGAKTDGDAFYQLGRMRQILDDLNSPLQIITNYERTKESLENEVRRSK